MLHEFEIQLIWSQSQIENIAIINLLQGISLTCPVKISCTHEMTIPTVYE